MKKLNFVIIGTGKIAHEYMQVINSFKTCKVTAVMNRTKAKGEIFAKKYKIKKIYDSIDSMIVNEKPDGILILASFDQIYTITTKIIKYNIPFLIEKPPGKNLKEFKALQRLNNKKVLNMIGFNRRFYSIFHKGLEIINSNGGLKHISIYANERVWMYKNDKKFKENIIFLNAIHTIDLVNFFAGKIVEANFTDLEKNIKNSLNLNVNLICEKNISCNYYINTFSPYYWSIKLFGKNITVIYNDFENGYYINRKFETKKIKQDIIDKKYKPGLYFQFRNFRKMILTKKNINTSANIENSIHTMTLAENINNYYLNKK